MIILLQSNFWDPIKLSLEVASVSVLIVFFCGILLGRLFSRIQFRGKLFLETLFLLPLVLPPTVIGFLLIILLGRNSSIGSLFEWLFHQTIMFSPLAAIIASSVVAFPLMYQTTKNGFQSIDRDIEEAARVDGANEIYVFLFITLPLTFKSILTGLILSFARALGEFGATFMFAGNIPGRTQTAPMAIYVAMEAGNMHLAWLLVISIIIISLIMLLFTTLFNTNNKKP